tara:strand:- start:100 stop:420 length:321 start_codon:yes stop_codon:yes gene_type:complete
MNMKIKKNIEDAGVRAGIQEYLDELTSVEVALTRREHELMEFFALGMGNERIAKLIGLVPKSVQRHRQAIMDKVNRVSDFKFNSKLLMVWGRACGYGSSFDDDVTG